MPLTILPFSKHLTYFEEIHSSRRSRRRNRLRRFRDHFGNNHSYRECFSPNVKVEKAEILNELSGSALLRLQNCPYCRGLLEAHDFSGTSSMAATRCKQCNWWVLRKHLWRRAGRVLGSGPCGLYGSTSWSLVKNRIHEGIVHSFDVSLLERPVLKLREHIHKRELDLRSISPKELEVVVGSVLRDHLDCRVRHVGGPGDEGIDLLLVQGKTTYAVQVKRRMNTKKAEGVAVVRDLLGSLVLGKLKRGIVVSTAQRFSTAAEHAAARTAFKISLFDYDMLMELVDLTSSPDPPWQFLLKKSLRKSS